MRRLVPAPALLSLVALLMLPAATGCSGGPDEAEREDGAIVSPGAVDVFGVRVGDCLDLEASEATAAQITDLAAVPCAQPHRHEVFHVGEVTGFDVYPGPSELSSASDGMCLGAFEDYVGVPYLDSDVQFTYLYPSLASWQDEEDREVVCILVSTSPQTRSLAAPGAEAGDGTVPATGS
ncbi:MAG: septum formation family protein [Acidimicrobiales bacterium]